MKFKPFHRALNIDQYRELTIIDKINIRSHRNALNINHLFSTVINDVIWVGMKDERKAHCKSFPYPQTSMYHHYGKRHSQYPLSYKSRGNNEHNPKPASPTTATT